VFTWVAVNLDKPEQHKHRAWVDLGGTLERFGNEGELKTRFHETTMTEEQHKQYNKAYTEAWDLAKSLIELEGVRRGSLSWSERRRAKRAIELFTGCLAIAPEAWPCMWTLGKLQQILNEDEAALGWFERAARIEPANVDVWREAFIQAGVLGHCRKSLIFAQKAVDLRPDDHGLLGNLAMALLLNRNGNEALAAAERACALKPDDQVNKGIYRFVRAVTELKTPWPRSLPKAGP
jgi:tetratricopeptide (TPR) repeat protein